VRGEGGGAGLERDQNGEKRDEDIQWVGRLQPKQNIRKIIKERGKLLPKYK